MSVVITDAVDLPSKIKKAGVPFTLAVLLMSVAGLGFAVKGLYDEKSDTRLAVIETRMDEMNNRLDKMDAKFEARFDKLDAKLDRALER
jgi:hypothetical protein